MTTKKPRGPIFWVWRRLWERRAWRAAAARRKPLTPEQEDALVESLAAIIRRDKNA